MSVRKIHEFLNPNYICDGEWQTSLVALSRNESNRYLCNKGHTKDPKLDAMRAVFLFLHVMFGHFMFSIKWSDSYRCWFGNGNITQINRAQIPEAIQFEKDGEISSHQFRILKIYFSQFRQNEIKHNRTWKHNRLASVHNIENIFQSIWTQ